MTKDEILKEINYKGKYTKEVKKKLNVLLKKYHPDNNKNDKKTILILYEIKKELEEGKIPYKESSIKNNNVVNKEDSSYVFFLESMVEKLKYEKEKINKEIRSLYNKINKLRRDKNKKQDELYSVEFDMLNFNNDMEELLKVDLLDKVISFLIVILCVCLFIFKNIIILLFAVLLFILEMYYIYIRYIDYEKKLRVVQSIEKKYKNVISEYNDLDKDIEVLEKEENKLKKKRNKINNNIQFYSRQISNIKDGYYDKDVDKEIVR